MDNNLTLLPDLSGHFSYTDAEMNDFPIFTNEPTLNDYRSFATQYHWHPDLALVLVLIDSSVFFVNGNTVTVKAGEAIFINSRRLHCCLSPEIKPGQHLAVRIKPDAFLTRTTVGKNYFERKFGFGNVDYIHFDNSEPWHREVIDLALDLHAKMQNVTNEPLPVMAAVVNLVYIIGSHIDDVYLDDNESADQILFLEMTRFVQDNYKQKILIADIANSTHVSRAKTYQLFERFAHMSPNTYLTNYRLAKSMDYLQSTNLSVLEIAALCGFQSPSYFTSVFRKEKGVTPKEYRALHNNM